MYQSWSFLSVLPQHFVRPNILGRFSCNSVRHLVGILSISTHTRNAMRASHIPPKSLPAPSTNPKHRVLAKILAAEFPSSLFPSILPRNNCFFPARGVWPSLGMAPRCTWVLFKNLVRHRERVTVCSRGPVRADTN